MNDYLERQRQQAFARGLAKIVFNPFLWKVIAFVVVLNLLARLFS